MKIELKDTFWLKNMLKEVEGKDVEYEDMRGPISSMKNDGFLVTINLSWQATYHGEGWIKCGDRLMIQFLNPKIELLDERMIRLTSGSEYCVIFFGYDCITPIIHANN